MNQNQMILKQKNIKKKNNKSDKLQNGKSINKTSFRIEKERNENIIILIDKFLKLISFKIAISMYFKRTANIKDEFFIPLLIDIFKNDIFNKNTNIFNFKKMNEYITEKMKPKRIRNKN